MAGDVIKEFLVGIGFQVEAGQERKFTGAIGSATKSAVALGTAAAAASAAVNAAVIKIGQALDSLYWQAQRANSSVSQIRATSYAISQLGGSVDGARTSIEGFGKQLRWNTAFEGYLQRLGVVTREHGKLRDSAKLARDWALAIEKLPKGVQKAHADTAGIDLSSLEAWQNPEFEKHVAKHAETLKRLGVNEDEAAKKANALATSLTALNDTFSALAAKLVDKLAPGLTQFFDQINTFILENSDKIVQFFERLGRVAGELAAIFDRVIKFITPLWEGFDKLTQSIGGVDGLTAVLTTLIGLKVMAWLLGVAAGIRAVGTAAGVALLGGALGKFLALFGIGAAAAIGMSTEANAGEDAEIARRRAAGTFGPAKAGELEADAAKRQATPKDSRNLWQRTMPKILGGKDAPAAAPGVQPSGTGGKVNSHFTRENADAVRAAAKELGTSPEDLATVIGYETDGTFSPSIRGGAGNRHIGLIQFGQAEQRQYGASQDQSFPEQMKAVVRYLKDRGFKPGMSLVDLYSTINAGRPGLHHRSDAGNGGAPGTVADKVRTMGPHAARARLFLGSGAEPEAPAAGGSSGAAADKQAGGAAGGAMPKYTPGSGEPSSGMGNAGVTSPERAAADKQAASDNLARIRKQMAAEDLAKSQTILDVTQFEEQLALADRNAGKATGGDGLGNPSAALAPPPASTAGTNVTIDQRNEINITGSGDPHDTAQQIGQTQRDVNGGLVRDLKTAVR